MIGYLAVGFLFGAFYLSRFSNFIANFLSKKLLLNDPFDNLITARNKKDVNRFLKFHSAGNRNIIISILMPFLYPIIIGMLGYFTFIVVRLYRNRRKIDALLSPEYRIFK